jgi:hypothetical protein
MFVLAVILILVQTPATCSSVDDCRTQALAAAAAGDYETFHDLAWRAVQKGRPNDPDLMFMLARAQSLSGRPGDALVMLQRLVDRGVAVDASGDDFRRVRALKGWAELEARMAGRPVPEKTTPPPEPEPPPTPAPAAPKSADAAPADPSEEALTFAAPRFDAVGLAYDAVSRRFIVGDRQPARLMVVDEVSHNVVNLVSAASAGFYDAIAAFEVDARRGDLWVASVKRDGQQSVLHKLQLVSGRVLEQIAVDDAELTDLAVTSDGTIVALAGDGRLFRVRPKARDAEPACRLDLGGPKSLALAGDRVAYVASDDGITQIDLQACTVVNVRGPKNSNIAQVDRIRWHDGSLILIDRSDGDRVRIAQLRLDAAGRTITRVVTLGMAVNANPLTATVANSHLYYLVSGEAGPSIRKVRVR